MDGFFTDSFHIIKAQAELQVFQACISLGARDIHGRDAKAMPLGILNEHRRMIEPHWLVVEQRVQVKAAT